MIVVMMNENVVGVVDARDYTIKELQNAGLTVKVK